MKRVFALFLAIGIIAMPMSVVLANTLDQVIQGNSKETVENVQPAQDNKSAEVKGNNGDENKYSNTKSYINNMKKAADLSRYDTSGAQKVNDGIGNGAAYIVNVASYALISALTVMTILDLIYIKLPMTRGILGGGAQAQQQNSGGFGGGFGNSGFGGGFGGGGFGGGFGSFGGGSSFGGSSFGGGAQQQGKKIQFVSGAAITAAAAEGQPGPDGTPQGPFKIYTKHLIIMLITIPVLLTLTVSGVLVNLGFLIGEVLSNAISGISSAV